MNIFKMYYNNKFLYNNKFFRNTNIRLKIIVDLSFVLITITIIKSINKTINIWSIDQYMIELAKHCEQVWKYLKLNFLIILSVTLLH